MNAMVVEFRLQGIPYEQQRRYDILYREEKVGDYIPDLLAFGKIVVTLRVPDSARLGRYDETLSVFSGDRELTLLPASLRVLAIRLAEPEKRVSFRFSGRRRKSHRTASGISRCRRDR